MEPIKELAAISAIRKCHPFNFDKRYKRQDIAMLSDSQIAFQTLGFYDVQSKIAYAMSGRVESEEKVLSDDFAKREISD